MHVINKTGYTVVGVETVEIPNITKTRANTFRAYTTSTGIVLLPGLSPQAFSPSSYFVDIAGRYCTAWTLPGTHERHNAKFLDAEQSDAFDAGIFLLQLRTHPEAVYTPLKTLEGFARSLSCPKQGEMPDWIEANIASRTEELMRSPTRRRGQRRRVTPPVAPMHVGPIQAAPAAAAPTPVATALVVPPTTIPGPPIRSAVTGASLGVVPAAPASI